MFMIEEHKHTVKCGNNYRIYVAGKGSVRLVFNDTTFLIRDVYYVSEIRNNLLSMGQFNKKGLSIRIKIGYAISIIHAKALIVHTKMSTNRMFILLDESSNITPPIEECLHTSSDLTYLWHQRYGHLSYKELKTLQTKKMVRGLPQLEAYLSYVLSVSFFSFFVSWNLLLMLVLLSSLEYDLLVLVILLWNLVGQLDDSTQASFMFFYQQILVVNC